LSPKQRALQSKIESSLEKQFKILVSQVGSESFAFHEGRGGSAVRPNITNKNLIDSGFLDFS
jgi:hypothetical protein